MLSWSQEVQCMSIIQGDEELRPKISQDKCFNAIDTDQNKNTLCSPRTKANELESHEVFYMRLSRYFPKNTPTKTIIDNLAYCMSVLVFSKDRNATEGIVFVANMENWLFINFSVSYCHNFMMMLQCRIQSHRK